VWCEGGGTALPAPAAGEGHAGAEGSSGGGSQPLRLSLKTWLEMTTRWISLVPS